MVQSELTPQELLELISPLSCLRHFPAPWSVAHLIGRMASSREQIEWLIEELLANYDEWPGPATVRRIFCQRFAPRDGREA